MEDFNELTESTFGRDIVRSLFSALCSFHKPIKLRPVYMNRSYSEMKSKDFYNLAYSYCRKDNRFNFGKMDSIAQIRFIELLASLTLFHFSKSSKTTFIDCLDIRGLEYHCLHFIGRRFTSMSGFEGKRNGRPRPQFAKYSVCYGSLFVDLSIFFNNHELNSVAKKFKVLVLCCSNVLFNDLVSDFCASFMHPGVEHVIIDIDLNSVHKKMSLQKFGEFFDYCKNVKTFLCYAAYYPLDSYDAKFIEIKRMIENWSTRTSRLESFIYLYKEHNFQLHKNKLKRCVQIDNKWFWSDKCDVDDTEYPTYPTLEYAISNLDIPRVQRELHHDDLFGIPPGTPFHECVQESIEIPADKLGLVIGKNHQTIKSLETTFTVKLLVIDHGKRRRKALKIGGKADNVARAKKRIGWMIKPR